MGEEVRVYGAIWSADTNRTRAHLKLLGVPYRYLDVDEDDSAAREVREWGDGELKIPAVLLAGAGERTLLSTPNEETLDEELAVRGLLPIPQTAESPPV